MFTVDTIVLPNKMSIEMYHTTTVLLLMKPECFMTDLKQIITVMCNTSHTCVLRL